MLHKRAINSIHNVDGNVVLFFRLLVAVQKKSEEIMPSIPTLLFFELIEPGYSAYSAYSKWTT